MGGQIVSFDLLCSFDLLRCFKHTLGCRHLLSHKQNSIEIQTYSAIMACMLIALWTGRKPTTSSLLTDTHRWLRLVS